MSKLDPNQPLDVRPINPETIPGIARDTKWTEEELWKQYRRSNQHDSPLMILVGKQPTHLKRKLAVAWANGKCFYELSRSLPYQDQMVCAIHNRPARGDVDRGEGPPCSDAK